MHQVLLIVGSLLPVISTIYYVASILRGQTKPQRTTRLLLLIIGILSFSALLAGHDRAGVWLAFVSLVQAVVIWILSFKRGMGGREAVDFICLGLCGLGLILWLVSGRSLFGLVMSITADVIACVPALLKTIRWPATETGAFYFLDVFAGICIAMAAPHTLEAQLFPLYIVVINAIFAAAVWWPRPSYAAENPTDNNP